MLQIKIFWLTIFQNIYLISLFAQADTVKTSKNIIYGEALGNSLIWSFNYERIFITKGMFQFSSRIGAGIYPATGTKDFEDFGNGLTIKDEQVKTTFTLPIEIIGSFGKKKHKMEVSFGYTSFIEYFSRLTKYPPGHPLQLETYNERVVDYFFTLNPGIAYRYEKHGGGFFLKAGIVGVMLFRNGKIADNIPFLPWPKLTIGYKIHHPPYRISY